MTFDVIVTVLVLAGVFGLLIRTRIGPDMVLLAGMGTLLVLGVLTPRQALQGFSNPGVVTVGILFVVAAGLRDTGAVGIIVDNVFGKPKSLKSAQTRLMLPVAFASGFMNNTPLVAMLIPPVMDWAKKLHLPVSKFLIPLSYAAILGGMCTLIGTSTNLVVDGLVRSANVPNFSNIGFFEITKIGVPCAIVGIAFMVLTNKWLLPDRTPPVTMLSDPREYVLEMLVEPGSPLDGKTIEEAGLRSLPGMYLMEVDRDGEVMAAVPPTTRLFGNDRLVFVGIVESVLDLQKIRGLKPATDQVFKLNTSPGSRALVEAVVSNSSPMLGKSIREGKFRKRYNAAVIAVARNGERVKKKIGDIVLLPGDTLLLEAGPDFTEAQRNSRDFFLVSRIEGYQPPRHDRAWVSLLILLGLVIATSVFQVDVLKAAFVAAGLMVLTRCCTGENARRAVEWRVLLAVGAAIGIGQAIEVSGVANLVGRGLIDLASGNPYLLLIIIYAITLLFTELVTNNAAAVLVFPLALSAAQTAGLDFRPFAFAIMIAASAGFATPIGYQTNLMVYGPGGYRFGDFTRLGLPLDLVVGATALAAIFFFFPMGA